MMGKIVLILVMMILSSTVGGCPLSASTPLGSPAPKAPPQIAMTTHPQQSLLLIENQGQIVDSREQRRPDIAFYTQGGSTQLYLRRTGLSYVFVGKARLPQHASRISEATGEPVVPEGDEPMASETTAYRLDVELLGSNPQPTIIGEDPAEQHFNYYYAHCPEGITGVKGYRRVRYQNVYPQIDLVYHIREDHIKYEFVVHPGGRAEDIRLEYRGEEELRLSRKGNLWATTPLGMVREGAPVSFVANARMEQQQEVPSKYHLEGSVLSFEIGEYDDEQTLIIDPDLYWSTYFGDNQKDVAYDLATDQEGNSYFTGCTNSYFFNADHSQEVDELRVRVGENYAGDGDVVVCKMAPGGKILWWTLYGGDKHECGKGIAWGGDGHDQVVVCGWTTSRSLPVLEFPGALNPIRLNDTQYRDGFAFRLGSDNGEREWATYLGGTGDDECATVAIGTGGQVFLAGTTTSADLAASFDVLGPTNQDQTVPGGGTDLFLVYINPNNSLVHNFTYYGGTEDEEARDIAVSSTNDVVVTGWTKSTSFAKLNDDFQPQQGGQEALIANFIRDVAGLRWDWAQSWGGNKDDIGNSIIFDEDDNIVIVGETWSHNANITAAAGFQSFQSSFGDPLASPATPTSNCDAFVLKVSNDGNNLLWSTFYGDAGDDRALAVTVDELNRIWLTGWTAGGDFWQDPASSPIPPIAPNYQVRLVTADRYAVHAGEEDCFVAGFLPTGERLWGSCYGSQNREYATGIAIGRFMEVIITGWAVEGASGSIPLKNMDGANQPSWYWTDPQCEDIFVANFDRRSFPTLVGGYDYDNIKEVVTDSQDDVLIAGETSSPIFPESSGAYHTENNPSDAQKWDVFVEKYSSNGRRTWSLFYGGSGSELLSQVGDKIALDGNDNIFFCGRTASYDFPVSSQFSSSSFGGKVDAFLVKFDPQGVRTWGRYFGGSQFDGGGGVVVNAQNDPVIVGRTTSDDLPLQGTTNATRNLPSDDFVAKFDGSDGDLVWSGFIGLSGLPDPLGGSYVAIAIDERFTTYPLYFVAGQRGSESRRQDVYWACLSEDGNIQGAGTLGGSNTELIYDLLFVHQPGVGVPLFMICGQTASTDFPTAFPLQPTLQGTSDGFIAFYSYNNSTSTATMELSSYWGGNSDDACLALAQDQSDRIWMIGATVDRDFPLVNCAVQTEDALGTLMYVTRLETDLQSTTSFCLPREFYVYDEQIGSSKNRSPYYWPHNCTIDSEGNPVIVGSTLLERWPQPYNRGESHVRLGAQGYRDGFILKLTADGAIWTSP